MQSLNEQLTALRTAKEATRDPALTVILNRSTADLQASGALDQGRGVGDRAPLFARPDLSGETVRLRSLLKKGPVVVSFFRGRW